jgi:hypothetical protein
MYGGFDRLVHRLKVVKTYRTVAIGMSMPELPFGSCVPFLTSASREQCPWHSESTNLIPRPDNPTCMLRPEIAIASAIWRQVRQ